MGGFADCDTILPWLSMLRPVNLRRFPNLAVPQRYLTRLLGYGAESSYELAKTIDKTYREALKSVLGPDLAKSWYDSICTKNLRAIEMLLIRHFDPILNFKGGMNSTINLVGSAKQFQQESDKLYEKEKREHRVYYRRGLKTGELKPEDVPEAFLPKELPFSPNGNGIKTKNKKSIRGFGLK